MTPNNFMQFQADAFRAVNDMVNKSAEGFQQLATLNTNFAKTAFERGSEQMQELMAAKNAEAVSKFVTEGATQSPDVAAYFNDVAKIATQANANMAEAAEQYMAQANEKIDEAIDTFAKSAPAGSEGAVTLMRQSVAQSRAAYQQATNAGKQFASMAVPAAKATTEESTAA